VTDFYADVPTWVVLIDQAQLIAVEVGQQFTSNHPLEIFTDELEAIEFAISIGWQPEPDPDLPNP
jgi:hypothetical protein